MSYLVLARKFRPQTFGDVVGQGHVVKTLKNALSMNRVAHAYLFAGPRGVGKTSLARIFAKALNCANIIDNEPCGTCNNCLEIARGNNLAVREIDGASHNSVENVRELIESFRSLPPPGSKYKIYLIDEVHMLSTAAFNALLKSLEEPPPNTVFMLATTEAHKIPDTVLSRCQRFDLRSLDPKLIMERLKLICEQEKISADIEALAMLSRLADGSLRDGATLLDRVSASGDGKVAAEDVGEILGVIEGSVLDSLSRNIIERRPSECLQILQQVFSRGTNPSVLIREFAGHFRELLLLKLGVDGEIVEPRLIERKRQVESLALEDLQDLFRMAREGSDEGLRSSFPKYALEALCVLMATREPLTDIASLIGRIDGALKVGKISAAPPNPADAASITAPIAATKAGKTMPAVDSAVEKTGEKAPPHQILAGQPILASPQRGDLQNTSSELAAPEINLNWNSFVEFAEINGGKVLGEHLKRISVEKFIPGILIAHGPDFSVSSLKSKDLELKLLGLLKKFSADDSKSWTLKFEPAAAEGGAFNSTTAPPGSIRGLQVQQKRELIKNREHEAASHPAVLSIKKAFPGSVIEELVVMEEDEQS